MTYRDEQWFEVLQVALRGKQRKDVAAMLGISAPALSQVMNASGKYGSGQASTDRIGEKVVHTFGRYECPHLSAEAGERQVITADTCRGYAHRPPPTASPRDMQHWQACNACTHKAASAPAPPRESKPRKGRGEAADTASGATTPIASTGDPS